MTASKRLTAPARGFLNETTDAHGMSKDVAVGHVEEARVLVARMSGHVEALLAIRDDSRDLLTLPADVLTMLADYVETRQRKRASEADKDEHRRRLAEEGVDQTCPGCGQVRRVLPDDDSIALCRACRRNRPVVEPVNPVSAAR